jgi:hypothetical protein
MSNRGSSSDEELTILLTLATKDFKKQLAEAKNDLKLFAKEIKESQDLVDGYRTEGSGISPRHNNVS